MKILFTLSLIIGLLSACTDDVPAVDDPHNIVIGGQKLKQVEFLQKYCVEKPAHETCMKVKNAMSKDFTKGEVPRF
jgi:hypothetical protein